MPRVCSSDRDPHYELGSRVHVNGTLAMSRLSGGGKGQAHFLVMQRQREALKLKSLLKTHYKENERPYGLYLQYCEVQTAQTHQ